MSSTRSQRLLAVAPHNVEERIAAVTAAAGFVAPALVLISVRQTACAACLTVPAVVAALLVAGPVVNVPLITRAPTCNAPRMMDASLRATGRAAAVTGAADPAAPAPRGTSAAVLGSVLRSRATRGFSSAGSS